MSRLRVTAGLVADLWRFSREGRRIAFFLLALVLLGLGLLIVATESSVVMPFIYAIF